MFDFITFAKRNNIPIVDEGHRQCRPGWIQCRCPFCGGEIHLGWNLNKGYFNCWKCGWFPTWRVICRLSGVDQPEALDLIKRLDIRTPSHVARTDPRGSVQASEVKLPGQRMTQHHRKYLEFRGFDPEKIERVYGLKGTLGIGPYKWRIIIPIFFKGELVSYQGRDITDQQELKYKACSKEKEIVHHKHILYALDLVQGDSVMVVEGVFDAWRFGPGCVATFGTGYSKKQARLLTNFKRVSIIFDPEEAAQKRARELGMAVAVQGIEVEILKLVEVDPADMCQDAADDLKKEIGM